LDKIGDQLPAIGITAASLTLVFLGFLFASWERYETPEGQAAVRAKYLKRGWIAFFGVAASLMSVLFGFIGIGMAHTDSRVDWAGVLCLAVWAALILWQAIISLRDMK
jgi:hypothetical protein